MQPHVSKCIKQTYTSIKLPYRTACRDHVFIMTTQPACLPARLQTMKPANSNLLACSQHDSSRTGIDKRKSLWGGFSVKGKQQRMWFAGDTGYCAVFKEIGQRLGPIDVALIPIGNYRPQWFVGPYHCSPSEAVQIHQVLGLCLAGAAML